jgi:enoyl-CoA hydratase/carnithine racemase
MSDVRYEVAEAVARATIDRPERRNAMSFGVMEGLRDAVAAAKADDDVRVLVLTGAGAKAFCAGADLGSGGIADGASAAHDGRGMLADLFRDFWGLGKPTIARVRGYALAGGFGLALACDFVVAAEDAQFGTPEVNVGLWPYMITCRSCARCQRTVPELRWPVGGSAAEAADRLREPGRPVAARRRGHQLAARLAAKRHS